MALAPPPCPCLQVIALANLRLKATHSSQTTLSAFRRADATQTWAPRAAASQTPYGKGTAMARRVRYVAGLRGPPRGVGMRVVEVQLDLGQPHQY